MRKQNHGIFSLLHLRSTSVEEHKDDSPATDASVSLPM